eukprot:CAMPEP_0206463452 /NCGR_PEP_ID=MMETSP0324_2-20121206/26612_1 /ASSEMBLY_ACC=CAM_ASM_000836 /TAXON_ID=2866 /ORGANISM="Crypthecodinium cohnii, Strain Seligo" /LENGTH=569 /DNA_ID=CAMNT_0053935861 /DNA_START=196 /DNA_END=1905 /DNA_ORIENTATION=-
MAATMLPPPSASMTIPAPTGVSTGSVAGEETRSVLGSSGGASNVNLAMKLAMEFFLQPEHYRKLNRTLAESWKNCHSLTAAVRLMEAHGVDVGRDADNPDGLPEWLTEMDDARAIEALVARMPHKTPEQFEHFFLQLSFIASTTQRIRTGLEGGEPELVEEALESAENVGVLPYLLKMCVSQAGQEVISRCAEHDAWLLEADAQLAPLLTISAEGMAVQKELTQAKSDILVRQENCKAVTCGVLSKLAGDNDMLLLGAVFHAFAEQVFREKRARAARADFDRDMGIATGKLTAFQESQMVKIKNVMDRIEYGADMAMLKEVLAAMRAETLRAQQQRRVEEAGLKIAKSTEEFAKRGKQNAKQVTSRMCGDSDDFLLTIGLQAFRLCVEEAKKEKERAAQLAVVKGEVEEFKARRKADGGAVLTTFAKIYNGAIVGEVLAEWKDLVKYEKLAAKVQGALNEKSEVVKGFCKQFKLVNTSVGERWAQMQMEQTLIFFFMNWKMETKVERMRRLGREKNEKRKKELLGVKGLFKDFASELETNLAKGTPRVEDLKPRKHRSHNNAGGPKVEA